MTKRPLILSAATAITLLAFGGTATASDNGTRQASEIRSCISEIGDHANYEDATRVQHMVIQKRRSRLGYVFTIDTSVYVDIDNEAIRKYASYCVARGENTPVKFSIDEVSS